ncbi:DUF1801 domain-containing protein [Flavivirga aquimarina]|uniref:DUF1801 domain-containing protein n=1 Tax=Flavivirga aquimarina TaxID=2027862 RepID=A0ABT8WFD8_9FLAO|nr:DUF1801 domain-containing protein [Flavivirga aquimarina]MDO5971875.1 DUF1801 domain-containing protein [Flavivirga aquimarina]
MKPTNNSVTEFIKSVQNETRQKDGFVVMEMMSKITELEPIKWGPSIIGFGKYIHKYESGRETNLPLTSFSPRKQHLVFYVLNGFENQEELLNDLGKHKTGNICLYINKLADVNIEILENIIVSSYNKNKRHGCVKL